MIMHWLKKILCSFHQFDINVRTGRVNDRLMAPLILPGRLTEESCKFLTEYLNFLWEDVVPELIHAMCGSTATARKF